MRDVPDSALEVGGEIPVLDLASGPDGTLHAVWRAVVADSARPSRNSDRLLYARSSPAGRWTPPIALVDRLVTRAGVRLLIVDGSPHVLYGPRVRHLASEDGGRTWGELDPLVPDGPMRADAFDATVAGDRLVVAALHQPGPADERRPGGTLAQRVFAVTWSRAGTRAARVVAAFPRSVFTAPAPRLVADGDRLHLLVGLNAERRAGEALGVAGRLFYLRSDDAGRRWSAPLDVSRDAVRGAASAAGILQSLSSLELLPAAGRVRAWYVDTILLTTASEDGVTWAPAEAVAPFRPGALSAAVFMGPVSLAARGGRGVLAWIDTRFRRTDRRWWNPLGGFPWSDDDPDWANNDVLMLRVGAGEAANRPPARLTPPLSQTTALAASASDARAILMWSGRPRVGKRRDSDGHGPRLFYAIVPLPAGGSDR